VGDILIFQVISATENSNKFQKNQVLEGKNQFLMKNIENFMKSMENMKSMKNMFLEVFFVLFGMGKKYFHYLPKKKREKPSTHASHTHEKSGLVGTMTRSGSYHMHCVVCFFNQVKFSEHHCSHVLTIHMYVCMYVCIYVCMYLT
jgi:predicted DNA-binding protein with PD1-like motif